METKFIAGNHTLAQLEAALRYEEAAFLASTGSEVGTQGGQAGNKVRFVPVDTPAGRLKLQFETAKAPAGHEADWSATMLVAGGPRKVKAWRAKAAGTGTAKRSAVPDAEALPALRPPRQASRFEVRDALLLGPDGQPVRQMPSPHHSAGNSRRYLVIHYTAGTTLEGAVSWFMNPAAKASAHFVVAADGSVVQMVGLDRRAWHAGESEWKGTKSLNAHSIGIEIVNAGKLRRTARGWVNWAERRIPDEEVTEATHRNETAPAGWHEYTAAQVDTVLSLAVALHAAFGFSEVLGHDDIAPGRKVDPGPLFPMGALRARLFGRQ